ncbi:MAG: Sir2 family NAD-dependent protein deacetylase [Candidatus Nezhaarchaeales archaeon]
MTLAEYIQDVAKVILDSRKVVALTGDCISSENKYPHFEPSQGLWRLVGPDSLKKDPSAFWRFQLEVIRVALNAQPTRAHYALAELERLGKLKSIITQSVDGLHLKAGSRNVIELYGNVREALCTNCGKVVPIEEVIIDIEGGTFPPRCRDCGNLLKTKVVLFNDQVPQGTLKKALYECKNCDLILVVGTSLRTYPATYLPVVAKLRGAKLVIMNSGPTPLDEVADVVVNANLGDVLASIVMIVRETLRQRTST